MKSQVSALMDGALDESVAASTLDAMGRSPELRGDWETWHLIGDTLRQTVDVKSGSGALSPDFTARFMRALGDEPTLLAPPRKAETPAPSAPARFRQLLPLAASVMGVGAVVWVAQTVGLGDAPSAVAVTAQRTLLARPAVTEPLHASAERMPLSGPALVLQPVALNQSSLREYVVAHEGYTPGPVMPGLARYQRGMAEPRQGGGQ